MALVLILTGYSILPIHLAVPVALILLGAVIAVHGAFFGSGRGLYLTGRGAGLFWGGTMALAGFIWTLSTLAGIPLLASLGFFVLGVALLFLLARTA